MTSKNKIIKEKQITVQILEFIFLEKLLKNLMRLFNL